MVTKEFLPFLKTPKNPYYYGSRKSTRQRRLNDGPVWPCTGALTSCTAANHRESICACRRDDLGVATVNVTRKRRTTPVRSIPAPRGRLRRATITTSEGCAQCVLLMKQF